MFFVGLIPQVVLSLMLCCRIGEVTNGVWESSDVIFGFFFIFIFYLIGYICGKGDKK